MKKAASILAVVVMSIGMFSCESESSLEETQALYQDLGDENATDGQSTTTDGRN
ncbi:hypothetical protein [Spongiimicrobium sp. 3-5]|uniref:hypothetical protein n=1 Tax=Spongiimicrobium sp. 3-5 TaxID=3332596 RepID=UPI003980C3E7